MRRLLSVAVAAVAVAMSASCTPVSHFKGTWYHHGAAITIDAAGNGVVSYRTYRWCGPGVPQPCDTLSGNSILDGGKATLHLTSPLTSNTGVGYLTSANEQPVGQRVTITTVKTKLGWPIVATISGAVPYKGVLYFCNPPTPADYDLRCGA